LQEIEKYRKSQTRYTDWAFFLNYNKRRCYDVTLCHCVLLHYLHSVCLSVCLSVCACVCVSLCLSVYICHDRG